MDTSRTTKSCHRRANKPVAIVCCVLVCAFVATACMPVLKGGSYTGGVITPNQGDTYEIVDQGTGFSAEAPTANTDINLRVAVAKDSAPVSVNQSACVTWNGPNNSTIQPGVVLRSRTADGHTRAIMVTNNVSFAFRPGFNVHLADSAAAIKLTQVGAGTLVGGVGEFWKLKDLPWRICARAIGATIDVMAWSLADFSHEPDWGTPGVGYSTQVPPQWVTAGRPGAYVGHVGPGTKAQFSDLDTDKIADGFGFGYWDKDLSTKFLLAVSTLWPRSFRS